MKLRPDEVGLAVTALLIAASMTSVGLPTWTASALRGLALPCLVSSVVYGRLARRGWQRRHPARHQYIEQAMRGDDAQTTEVIDESEL